MEHPTISVIIPVYNAEAYLSRCLDSVIGQTYTNLEILLVDDGSSDGSGTICDEYAAKDTRIAVIHTENQGAYAARNRALDIATGDFISFVDADDWLDIDTYQTLMALALEHNADIAQCEMHNEGSYQQIRTQSLGRDMVYSGEELTLAVFREEITHGLIGKIFRAGCFSERRFDEVHIHLDAVMLSAIRQYCDTFVRTDAALYHYNTTNVSITRGKKRPLHIKSAENLFEAYSVAAPYGDPDGSFFICREIPSAGRLILPGREITRRMAIEHIRTMHRIFCRHWDVAKTANGYQNAPNSKKFLWHIYRFSPIAASILTYLYSRMRNQLP